MSPRDYVSCVWLLSLHRKCDLVRVSTVAAVGRRHGLAGGASSLWQRSRRGTTLRPAALDAGQPRKCFSLIEWEPALPGSSHTEETEGTAATSLPGLRIPAARLPGQQGWGFSTQYSQGERSALIGRENWDCSGRRVSEVGQWGWSFGCLDGSRERGWGAGG